MEAALNDVEQQLDAEVLSELTRAGHAASSFDAVDGWSLFVEADNPETSESCVVLDLRCSATRGRAGILGRYELSKRLTAGG